MTPLALLEEVNSLGVEVRSNGTNLILSPAGKLPKELKERLREAKPQLIARLRAKPATYAESCYEIEPGRWLHHPWNGCTTRPGEGDVASKVVSVAAECEHCGGIGRNGKCGCVTCAFGLPVGEEGDCTLCSRRGMRGLQ